MRLRRLRIYVSTDKTQQDNDKEFLNSLARCAALKCIRRPRWKDMIPCPKCYRCFCERDHFREAWKWGADACYDCVEEWEDQMILLQMRFFFSVVLAGAVSCVLVWALFLWRASLHRTDKVVWLVVTFFLGMSLFILIAGRFGCEPKYLTLSEWKRYPYH